MDNQPSSISLMSSEGVQVSNSMMVSIDVVRLAVEFYLRGCDISGMSGVSKLLWE